MGTTRDIFHWYHVAKQAPSAWWIATAGTTGYGLAKWAHTGKVPASLRIGGQMASFGVRVTWNTAMASSRAFLGTTIVRGGTMTVGAAAAQAAAAVAIPVILGYGVSHMIAGEEGTDDYMDYLHSYNPMSDRGITPREYWDTVTLKSLR